MRKIAFRNILRYWHNQRDDNHINWLKTLQINFMLLPFCKAVKLPILVYGPCELGILRGNIIFSTPPYKGILRIGLTDPLRNISTPTFVSVCGNLIIGRNIILRRGIRMRVEHNATLQIQDNTSIGVCCSIQVTRSVSIGNSTSIGNNTTIMDTDFHYIVNMTDLSIKNYTAPIEIGEQNWIGSNCTIKKGTRTPKGTIIAGPYSMVSKDYTSVIKEYCLIAGSPAKLLIENVRRINNTTSEQILRRYFKSRQDPYIVQSEQIEAFCLPSLNNKC